jgi:hypothetical protein
MGRLERLLDVELDEIVRRLDLLSTALTSSPVVGGTNEHAVGDAAAGLDAAVRTESRRLLARSRMTPPSPKAIGTTAELED